MRERNFPSAVFIAQMVVILRERQNISQRVPASKADLCHSWELVASSGSHYHRKCQWCWWQLYPIHHNAGPKFVLRLTPFSKTETLCCMPVCILMICSFEGQRARGKRQRNSDLSSANLLPKWLQQQGGGQAKARNQKLQPGLLHAFHNIFAITARRNSRKLDLKKSSQGHEPVL